ncbi:Aldo/keto reductase [Aspergillus ellipticus CBS 707.79]|uniref:Aldo/keto reductase n=1 Tax=Aspergillus ellipticus CBS 707.79 TaxID=1448320 RepID=A0A319D5F6_9EURO|nr:Aldo/keto reductase [Aspergillus ellipticus CBS 707.79]
MTAPRAKTAHVNMMTDTIIASMPLDGLRMVVRGMLASQPSFTSTFEERTRNYISDTASRYSNAVIFEQGADNAVQVTPSFEIMRRRIRCMIGCGMCFQAPSLLQNIVDQVAPITLKSEPSDTNQEAVLENIASVDGDIVQTITAVQKTLFVESGVRELSAEETAPLDALLHSLLACRDAWVGKGQTFVLERGLDAIIDLLHPTLPDYHSSTITKCPSSESPHPMAETFQLDSTLRLPRIFTGLWQLSSPAWGFASRPKIMEQFSKYVSSGFTAFDMADHYGDAEIIFGKYRSSSGYSDSMFAATKYCVFHPMTVSSAAVRANVSERCHRLRTDKLDLLQFHWQFYDDPQYLDALRYLQEDERVKSLGLCNFDTEHMQRVVDSGVNIVTNQVQFSLIDSRPTMKMAKFCAQHNIKLLTYGTLCGGLLAEKWIDQDPPDLYSETMTPSQRKYYAMIRSWGTWDLFQELLRTLRSIAQKHCVTVSNVATRWVLDFPCVGAVIVGARMGVSEQSQENLASLGWSLDAEDQGMIEGVLERSRRTEMLESMGDCGGEYR